MKIKISIVDDNKKQSTTEGYYDWTKEQIAALKDFMHQLYFHNAHRAGNQRFDIFIKEEN